MECGNLRRRSAFWLCFFAGLTLTFVSFLGAIVCCAGDAALFQSGVDRYVVAYGSLTQSDADAFVTQTMAYLNGEQSEWAPAVRYGDHPLVIPQTFTAHMATVRGWLQVSRYVLPLATAIALGIVGLAYVLSGRKGKRRFPLGGYALGWALPLLLALGVGLWGVLDFSGFWAWLHSTLIPDGIFSAQEEIMRLFPLDLFADYIAPVGVTFGLFAGAALLLPPAALGLRGLAVKRRDEKSKKLKRER
ncbi:MAG: DUF1461 domain-containing protein [Eubacteriales bacterium]|nr:DUF1461 domain-containing protein [Eubacteriales bacterium]